MKSLIGFSALGLLALGTAVAAKEGGSLDPTGTWLTEDGRAKVRVEKCGADHAHICGTIVWIKDPVDDKGRPKTDNKNPDPAKRNRLIVGMPLFSELTPDDDQVYAGKIYNAENGKDYDVTFDVDKPADLHVKGCMLAILCGSQHWSRINDVAPAVVATSQTKQKTKAAPAE